MSYTRNDPSSLSFGRRMQALEHHAAAQAKQIEELKKGQLSPEEKLAGKELAAARKSERMRAKQMFASHDSTLDDLATLNTSLLTRAEQEQLRHHKNGLLAASFSPLPAFTEGALARIQNFRQSGPVVTASQQQDFAASNLAPEPESNFQKWDKRQRSIAGRLWNSKQQKAEYERTAMLRRAEAKLAKPKAEGINLGKVRPLNK